MVKGSTIVAAGLGVMAASGLAWWLTRPTSPTFIQNPEGLPCTVHEDCKNPMYGCSNGKCTIHGP